MIWPMWALYLPKWVLNIKRAIFKSLTEASHIKTFVMVVLYINIMMQEAVMIIFK